MLLHARTGVRSGPPPARFGSRSGSMHATHTLAMRSTPSGWSWSALGFAGTPWGTEIGPTVVAQSAVLASGTQSTSVGPSHARDVAAPSASVTDPVAVGSHDPGARRTVRVARRLVQATLGRVHDGIIGNPPLELKLIPQGT